MHKGRTQSEDANKLSRIRRFRFSLRWLARCGTVASLLDGVFRDEMDFYKEARLASAICLRIRGSPMVEIHRSRDSFSGPTDENPYGIGQTRVDRFWLLGSDPLAERLADVRHWNLTELREQRGPYGTNLYFSLRIHGPWGPEEILVMDGKVALATKEADCGAELFRVLDTLCNELAKR